MESLVIDTEGLAALSRQGSVLIVDCCRHDSNFVQVIPSSKVCNVTWNLSLLQRELSSLELSSAQEIVVYDAKGPEQAARLWWVLRTLGYERVRVLDGGIEKWIGEYGKVVEKEAEDRPEKALVDLSRVRASVLEVSDLLESGAQDCTVLQTNTLQGLHDKLLNPDFTLKSLDDLRQAWADCEGILEAKELVVGGRWAGTVLLVLHALGKVDCKVLSDEPPVASDNRATVFYDMDAVVKSEFEPGADYKELSVESGHLKPPGATQGDIGRQTRFYSVTSEPDPPLTKWPSRTSKPVKGTSGEAPTKCSCSLI
jgi:rhodanese-related sulfurtransferase